MVRFRQIPGAFQLLLAASFAVPAILFALAAWLNWRQLDQEAHRRAAQTAGILQEHAARVFETHRLVLERVDYLATGLDWDQIAASRPLFEALNSLRLQAGQINAISLIDPSGRVRLSTVGFPTQAVDVSDRAYFIQARDVGGLYVGEAFTGRLSNKRVFTLSRPRLVPGGGFDGLVQVSAEQDYFAGVYRSVSEESGDSVTLARADGAVLVREPGITTGVEKLSPQSGLMRAIAENPDRGFYRITSELDQTRRLHAYRRVDGFPVYVSYGFGLVGLQGQWYRNLAIYGAFAGLSALGLAALTLVAARRVLEAQAATARLTEEAERRERAEAALRQSQKMEAIGQLTGGIAHDFNNLLTVVIGNVELLQRSLPEEPPRLRRAAESARRGAERAAVLTQRLLAFSRKQALSPQPLGLNTLVGEMMELIRRTIGEQIDVETVLAAGLWPSYADPHQVENALLNLVINARDAMPGGGRLTIETANSHLDDAYAAAHDVAPGQYVMICVTDTGTGMPPEVQARVFEPFFTTKEVGQGTGLGLSMVYGFVRQSRGHVKIYSEPGHGTTVKIYLPRHNGEARAVPAPGVVAPAPLRGQGEVVLVVEDDEDVRRTVVQHLGELGYAVLEAPDGATALAVLAAAPRIDLLFTDVVLPGGSGRELVERARALRPELRRVLYATGYTRNAIVHNGVLDAGVDLLSKPFTQEALARKLREVLDRP
ncbi:MAG TPA: ATP-binding protein [Alphaproteobacteria bacterium]|nr:ATP-binding protein [Alphaproteobacteria bacterium]